MKDKDGNLMNDSHLRKILSEELKWVNSVYEKTSNFIHFSSTHIFSAADPNHKMKDESTHRLFIGPKDTNASDENYLDAITVFRSITPIISHYIEGWIFAKDNPYNTLNDEN